MLSPEETLKLAVVACVSGLTGSPDQSCVYELSAVLIHRGISAYSGHYIAHVKDAHTGDWYKFNDEEIEKMEGKKLQLGLEEDIGRSRKGSFAQMAARPHAEKVTVLVCLFAS